ncbi:MAG: DUF547 domain-containing protein [Desulfobacterales bacterium]|nr:DUF547 domain-containing protein [Desulfobacterales bacterium]
MKKNIILTLLLIYPFVAHTFDHNHTLYDNILKKNIKLIDKGIQSKVNYSALKKDSKKFEKYLTQLSAVTKKEFDSWSKNQQLSFLINAYNAFTIELILKNYPVKSIKETGSFFKGPWKVKFINLIGKKISLDDIEHELIRKKGIYDEPRIHFAVVCASIGCPAIQNEAFTAEKLDLMLEKGLINFLSDQTRNRYNKREKVFEVSKIFKWYDGDFKKRYGSVIKLLNSYGKYITAKPSKNITDIEYLNYDWNLNDTK